MAARAIGTTTGVAVGGAVGAYSRGPSLMDWPAPVRTAFPFLVGGIAGTAAGVKAGFVAACAEAMTGRGRWPVPTAKALATAAVAVGAGAAFSRVARRIVLEKMSTQGLELDAGFTTRPTDPNVSGSPASLVGYETLGREGARFVSTVVAPEDITFVTGKKPVAEPVRVFVGVDSAPTVEDRVAMAMAELRRTGAFDRAHLLVQSPSGSGYANPTPVSVLEILSLGNCASVVIGYGLLPSFMSLGKVEEGSLAQSQLFAAIDAEVEQRKAAGKPAPQLLVYGESLGAEVQQAAIPDGLRDMDELSIDRALYVGTPGSIASDRFHAGCAGSSTRFDRPEQIPVEYRGTTTPAPRAFFLEHDGDPVVRFRTELFTQRPDWLPTSGERCRNVPAGMTWKPGITWLQVGIDTLYATDVKPGDFQSHGHDYRADLGAATTAAFRLPADADTAARLEQRLRALEVARAHRIDGVPAAPST